MKKPGPLLRILVASWMGTCSAALAAAQWYQVEVIAFRYQAEEDAVWSSAPALPDLSQARRLFPAPAAGEGAAPGGWQALPAHELALSGAARALVRTGRIEPLFHIGWRQPAGPGYPIYLSSAEVAEDGMTEPGLEGSLQLGTYRRGFNLRSNFVARTTEADVLLGERRQVGEGELHYLDHPLIGMLVRIAAWAPPDIRSGQVPAAPPVPAGGQQR